jgi:hypothetical protein
MEFARCVTTEELVRNCSQIVRPVALEVEDCVNEAPRLFATVMAIGL